jgi:hypothetical protein
MVDFRIPEVAMAETTPKNAQSKGFVGWCAKELETLDPINAWLRLV